MTKKKIDLLVESYLNNRYKNKYKRDTKGFWLIYGEDPNCDFGGPHHQPLLGIAEGKFIDALKYAVNLGGFYTWGCGGEVVPVKPVKIDEGGINSEELRETYSKKKVQLENLKAEVSELELLLRRLKDDEERKV